MATGGLPTGVSLTGVRFTPSAEAGVVYALTNITAKQESVPEGQFVLKSGTQSITIPEGVTRLSPAFKPSTGSITIGVTSGKTYQINVLVGASGQIIGAARVLIKNTDNGCVWIGEPVIPDGQVENALTWRYSPEINKMTPTVEDY